MSLQWLRDRVLRVRTGRWVSAAGQQGSMLSTSTLVRARLTPARDTLELPASPRPSTRSRRRDTAPGGGGEVISEGSTQCDAEGVNSPGVFFQPLTTALLYLLEHSPPEAAPYLLYWYREY